MSIITTTVTKTYMKKLFLSFVVAFSFVSVDAQVVFDYLKAADNYFKNGDYYSAAEYYEKYLGKGNTKTVAPTQESLFSKILTRFVFWLLYLKLRSV